MFLHLRCGQPQFASLAASASIATKSDILCTRRRRGSAWGTSTRHTRALTPCVSSAPSPPSRRNHAAPGACLRCASPRTPRDAEVLAGLDDPVILDVRDPDEVAAGKGGPPASVPGAVHVPLNVDGAKQSERPTTQEEFLAAIAAAGLALPRDRPVVAAPRLGRPRRQGGLAAYATPATTLIREAAGVRRVGHQ